jgi:hypothetical protein
MEPLDKVLGLERHGDENPLEQFHGRYASMPALAPL